MLRDYLEKLKKERCLRFSLQERFKEEDLRTNWFKQKYPKLLANARSGISIPYGWSNILDALLISIKDLDVEVVQIKQKMGNLRVYLNKSCSEAEKCISIAESLASNTCEFCMSSEDVQLYNDGYISNSCKDCRLKIAEATVLFWVLEGKNPMNDRVLGAIEELRNE